VDLIQQIDACCSPFLESPLRAEEAEILASALKVLADPARLRLVSLIAAQPSREACVCNLTAPIGLSQPTVSHHLRVLSEAGILERERRGRWVFYRLVDGPLRVLGDALSFPTGDDPALAATSAR
jgi:ArsR family transcriptional regulator